VGVLDQDEPERRRVRRRNPRQRDGLGTGQSYQ
jgi:hypothetical protein